MLRLEWPANPADEFVTSYLVYESVNGGPFTLKATVNEPFLQFNSAPGHYAWKVVAANFVGQSEESEVTEGPDVPSAPPAPTLLVL